MKDISVIGAAVIDVLAGPVGEEIFHGGSRALQYTKLSFGGDALNESVNLSRLGKKVELISKVGTDEVGSRVRHFISENGISLSSVKVEENIETGINIVMVDKEGERIFLTNPNSCLRKFSEEDIMPYLNGAADIVSFASLFVSYSLDISAIERIFKTIKQKKGRILSVDTTSPKFGETLSDIRPLFQYIDYFMPNHSEISALTGENDPEKNTRILIEAGLNCAVIKCGKEGCIIRRGEELYKIPAFPGCKAIDSTGAGDAFASGFLYALSEGFPLMECGRFASALASLAVENVGATDGITSLEEPMRRYKAMI